jgi:hypothetical protein
VVEGVPNKLIADQLDISVRTVEVHRARVFDKMQVKSAVELANLLRPRPPRPERHLRDMKKARCGALFAGLARLTGRTLAHEDFHAAVAPRPSLVLEATGWCEPMPCTWMRAPLTPRESDSCGCSRRAAATEGC